MRKIFYLILCLICLHLLSTDASAYNQHKVKKGDTLYRIARRYGVSVEELKKVNSLHGTRIHPGDVITIPASPSKKSLAKSKKNNPNRLSKNSSTKSSGTDEAKVNLATHIVEKGENLYRISFKFGISIKELKRINNLSRTTIKIGQALLVPSVENEEDLPDAIEEPVIEEPVDGIEVAGMNEGDAPPVEGGNASDKILAENSEEQVTEPEKAKGWLSLIDVAMDYIGIPYRFGGSSLRGIDCSAFVQMVYRYFSIDLPRTAREQFKAGVRVSKKELRIGDLIFFRTYAKYPSHVGIYIGEGKMIHASSRNKKVTITSINEPYYVRRYIGAVRLPESPSMISTEGINSLTN